MDTVRLETMAQTSAITASSVNHGTRETTIRHIRQRLQFFRQNVRDSAQQRGEREYEGNHRADEVAYAMRFRLIQRA